MEDKNIHNDHCCRIYILGTEEVGKSSLAEQLRIHATPINRSSSGISSQWGLRDEFGDDIQGQLCVHVVDSVRYGLVAGPRLAQVDGQEALFIIVYDIASRPSFEQARKILTDLKEYRDTLDSRERPIVLVGNISHTHNSREITHKEAGEFADKEADAFTEILTDTEHESLEEILEIISRHWPWLRERFYVHSTSRAMNHAQRSDGSPKSQIESGDLSKKLHSLQIDNGHSKPRQTIPSKRVIKRCNKVVYRDQANACLRHLRAE